MTDYPLPRVETTIHRDFETDSAVMRAYQHWTHLSEAPKRTFVELPLQFSRTVLIEEPVLRAYIIGIMNWQADQAMLYGYTPRPETDYTKEPVLYGMGMK